MTAMVAFCAPSGQRAPAVTRRQLVEGTALGMGLSLLAPPTWAQPGARAPLAAHPSEVQRIVVDFIRGSQPLKEGLRLDLPVLGDNPASVPVRAWVEWPMTPASYCCELILIAEGNPHPLACSFRFSAHAGTAEIGIRLRLVQSQAIQALARMNDGRVLVARRHIQVTAGNCGM